MTEVEKAFSSIFGGGYLSENPVPFKFTQSLTSAEQLSALAGIVEQYLKSQENYNSDMTATLKKMFEDESIRLDKKFSESVFLQKYLGEIKEYSVKHISSMIAEAVKYITFGLDDNGYFFAEIPSNYSNIEFDTIADVESVDFGKLTLKY